MKIVNAVPKKYSLFTVLSNEVALYSGKLSDKDKNQLFHELANLMATGKALRESIADLIVPPSSCKYAHVISRIRSRVLSGQSLSKAIKGSDKFSKFDRCSIQLGEKTDQLEEVLKQLAFYYRDQLYHRKKIRGAAIFPAVLTLTALMLLITLLPLHGDIFLPGVLLLPALLLLIYTHRETIVVRRVTSAIVIRIPGLGELVRQVYLLRLCHMLQLMFSVRLPLDRALSAAGKLVDFYPLEFSLSQMEKEIAKGRPLHECLHHFSIYPIAFVQLFQTDQLPQKNKQSYTALTTISNQLRADIDQHVPTFHRFAAAMITIFAGLAAGFMVLAMH